MTELTFPPKPQKCAIILNGARSRLDAQTAPLWDKSGEGYQQIIVADGAWDDLCQQTAFLTLSSSAQIVAIGDGDSIKDKPEHFISIDDPNTTDFEKALAYAVAHSITDADVFWGSGGEMDHFLGNLSVAANYAENINLRFFDDKQCYFFVSGQGVEFSILGANGNTISLYPFPSANVSSRGLRYPLDKLSLDLCRQQSLRNQIIAERATLSVSGATWAFIALSAD